MEPFQKMNDTKGWQARRTAPVKELWEEE